MMGSADCSVGMTYSADEESTIGPAPHAHAQEHSGCRDALGEPGRRVDDPLDRGDEAESDQNGRGRSPSLPASDHVPGNVDRVLRRLAGAVEVPWASASEASALAPRRIESVLDGVQTRLPTL